MPLIIITKPLLGLATGLSKIYWAAIKAAKLNPTYNSFRYDDVRFAVVKKFPYAAHYTIGHDSNMVKIQAVLAFNQNPDTNWRIRF